MRTNRTMRAERAEPRSEYVPWQHAMLGERFLRAARAHATRERARVDALSTTRGDAVVELIERAIISSREG